MRAAAPQLPRPVEEELRLEDGRRLRVIRDDLLPGGTKVRALIKLLAPGVEYVYAGPAEGYAQIALARAAQLRGARATVFVAARAMPHANTRQARSFGASVQEVRPGYLSVVSARALAYCGRSGATLLPFGLDTPAAQAAIAAAAAELQAPAEAWCVAGSGLMARSLAAAWPGAAVHAVRIGREPRIGSARPWRAPERFEQPARRPPPFPSSSNYDAKAWAFLLERAADGALFWNVGA